MFPRKLKICSLFSSDVVCDAHHLLSAHDTNCLSERTSGIVPCESKLLCMLWLAHWLPLHRVAARYVLMWCSTAGSTSGECSSPQRVYLCLSDGTPEGAIHSCGRSRPLDSKPSMFWRVAILTTPRRHGLLVRLHATEQSIARSCLLSAMLGPRRSSLKHETITARLVVRRPLSKDHLLLLLPCLK